MKSIQVSDELHERIMNLREPYKQHISKLVRDMNVTAPLIISVAIMELEKKIGEGNASH